MRTNVHSLAEPFHIPSQVRELEYERPQERKRERLHLGYGKSITNLREHVNRATSTVPVLLTQWRGPLRKVMSPGRIPGMSLEVGCEVDLSHLSGLGRALSFHRGAKRKPVCLLELCRVPAPQHLQSVDRKYRNVYALPLHEPKGDTMA